jgi:tetratricopeptide (TPR) repeat protein
MKNIPENAEIISQYKIPKQAITDHIIKELIHYTFIGVNKLYVYSYVGNIYMNKRDYANALRFFKMAYEFRADPKLAELIRRLETMKKAM